MRKEAENTIPEDQLRRLRESAGDDAVTYASVRGREWVCVCGTCNPFDPEEGIQNCARCHRNRDFVLKRYGEFSDRFPNRTGEPDSNIHGTVEGGHSQGDASALASHSAVRRYKNAYLVATAASTIGMVVKGIGILAMALLFVVGFVLASQGGDELLPWVGVSLVPILVGGPVYAFGVLVAAIGELVKSSLDIAVTSSPFLSHNQMAKVMSL